MNIQLQFQEMQYQIEVAEKKLKSSMCFNRMQGIRVDPRMTNQLICQGI